MALTIVIESPLPSSVLALPFTVSGHVYQDGNPVPAPVQLFNDVTNEFLGSTVAQADGSWTIVVTGAVGAMRAGGVTLFQSNQERALRSGVIGDLSPTARRSGSATLGLTGTNKRAAKANPNLVTTSKRSGIVSPNKTATTRRGSSTTAYTSGGGGGIPSGVAFRDDFTGAIGTALSASYVRVPDATDTTWTFQNAVADKLRINHTGATGAIHGYVKSVATYAVGAGRYVKAVVTAPAVEIDNILRGFTLVGDNGRIYAFGMQFSSQYDASDYFIGYRWDIIYRTGTTTFGAGSASMVAGPTLTPAPGAMVTMEARFTSATSIQFYLDGNPIGSPLVISSLGTNMSVGPSLTFSSTTPSAAACDCDWIEVGGV